MNVKNSVTVDEAFSLDASYMAVCEIQDLILLERGNTGDTGLLLLYWPAGVWCSSGFGVNGTNRSGDSSQRRRVEYRSILPFNSRFPVGSGRGLTGPGRHWRLARSGLNCPRKFGDCSWRR